MQDARRILPERIEGDGVLLRRWLVADAESLAGAVTESEDHLRPWMAFMAHEPQTLEQRRAMLRERECECLQGGDVLFGIFVAHQVAGSCGLHRRRGASVLEIGYWLHPSYLRRGLATAVVRLLTDAAFSVDAIERVEIHHDKANVASAAIPRRLGFRYVGETADVPTAPAEVGIDCTWQMDRRQWAQRSIG
ncbi:MAG: GNAT family N-acetyltransferase [Chloroflexota bacterium]|nr:GNAT family N-acetyltransferase [Chloroflexota bacterium]